MLGEDWILRLAAVTAAVVASINCLPDFDGACLCSGGGADADGAALASAAGLLPVSFLALLRPGLLASLAVAANIFVAVASSAMTGPGNAGRPSPSGLNSAARADSLVAPLELAAFIEIVLADGKADDMVSPMSGSRKAWRERKQSRRARLRETRLAKRLAIGQCGDIDLISGQR